MVTLAIGGHKTTSRAAKWLSTGKLKLSRVTSGYGGDILPLSQVRPPALQVRPPVWFDSLKAKIGPLWGDVAQRGQLSPFFTVSHRGEFPSATNRKYKSWKKMIVLPNFAALSWCLQRHYQQHRLQLRFVLILQSISPKVLLLHFLRWIHHGFVREKSNFLEIWEIIDRCNCIIVRLIL